MGNYYAAKVRNIFRQRKVAYPKVKNAAAFFAYQMMMVGNVAVKAVGRFGRDAENAFFTFKNGKIAINRGDADGGVLCLEGNIKLLGRGMVFA